MLNINEEMMVLVNEFDQSVGLLEKIATHKQGKLHRAFSVFIFRLSLKDGMDVEILLQKRHPDKYHCGGLWTNACCSHPRLNENILLAGKRRLKEELFLDIDLHYLDKFIYKVKFDNGLTEHELDHILLGIYQKDVFDFNRKEVQEVKWISLNKLDKVLKNKVTIFTPWFLHAYLITQVYENNRKIKSILNNYYKVR